MKNTNPVFSLKNFRSFGEDGADFELAPITVLTGCNSAGKSSLVKSLMLLSCQKIEKYEDGTMRSAALKTSSSELKLGGYKNIIHLHDSNRNLIFIYSMWSRFLNKNIICRCIYKQKKGVLNDGQLSELTIEKEDGTLFFQGKLCNQLSDALTDGNVHEIEYLDINDELTENISDDFNRFTKVYKYWNSKNILMRIAKTLSNRKDCHKVLLDMISGNTGIDIEKLESFGFTEDISYDFLGNIIDKYNDSRDALISSGIALNEADEYDKESFINWTRIIENYNVQIFKWKDIIEETFTDKERDEINKKLFYDSLINEIINPLFLDNLTFVDSSTNKISRTYNVDDKDKLSRILFQLLSRSNSNEYHTSNFVNKWLEEFEIADSIVIVGTEENNGVRVYLKKGEKRQLLADEGYGITQLSSLLLQIDITKNKNRYIDGDGIIGYHRSFICVEEPEIHLHPKYQSLLADMFVEAYREYNIHFIIETHSEYLVRKLQVMVADKENVLTSNDVSLNYVEKDENGISTNRKIDILEDGRLSEPFGTGFFDESKNLVLKMMKF